MKTVRGLSLTKFVALVVVMLFVICWRSGEEAFSVRFINLQGY